MSLMSRPYQDSKKDSALTTLDVIGNLTQTNH